MPQVGFESTIPAFERAKIFHALGFVATVIGRAHIQHKGKKPKNSRHNEQSISPPVQHMQEIDITHIDPELLVAGCTH
jgi:hypothetical protein